MAALGLHTTGMLGRHIIQAYDCYGAVAVEKFRTDRICTPPETGEETPTDYHLYQLASTTAVAGVKCTVRKSSYPAMCGVWGHLKISDVPQIIHQQPVSAAWCSEMYSRKKFKTSQTGTSYPLELNKENYLQQDEVGSLTRTDSTINCKGQNMKFRKKLFTNSVLLSEYIVTIMEVKLRAQHQVIESMSDHLQLPCTTATGQCDTGSGTFVWTPPTASCNLQFVRTIQARTYQQTFLVDEEHRVILNNTGLLQPTGCSQLLTSTQYPKLFLSSKVMLEYHQLVASNLDIEIEIQNSAQFLLYLNSRVEHRLQTQLRAVICSQQSASAEEPIRLHDNIFIMARGSVTYRFRCPVVNLQLLTHSKCFADLPVQAANDKTAKWVSPITRVLKKHSTPAACSTHFPLVIQEKKLWLELPSLRPVSAPKNHTLLTLRADEEQMLDLATGGLYTTAEIQSWEALLSFPTYHTALLKSISLGACIGSNLCAPVSGQTAYDLENMMALPGWHTPWEYIKHQAELYGGTCSIVMLFYVIGKLMINAILIGLTAIREGPAAVLALLVELFAANTLTYRRIRARNRKARQRKQRREAFSSDEGINLTRLNPSAPLTEVE